MPAVTPQLAFLIGTVVAPAVFTLCAYSTRASPRRTASALVGLLAFILVQYAWDRAAAVAGWWSYPAYGTTRELPMPIPIYLFSGLVYAGFGLIGWRLGRRHGWKGLCSFVTAWSLWGFVHDNVGSSLFANSRLMVIGPGALARVADFLTYATCMASVLLAIRLAGGPLGSDRLARA